MPMENKSPVAYVCNLKLKKMLASVTNLSCCNLRGFSQPEGDGQLLQ